MTRVVAIQTTNLHPLAGAKTVRLNPPIQDKISRVATTNPRLSLGAHFLGPALNKAQSQ